MKFSFVLALLALMSSQVLALMFERAPQYLKPLGATPLLTPAGVSPAMLTGLGVLLFMLFFTRLRREPGPLAAGSFLTGLGHVGLQILALEWLKPYSVNPVNASVVAFGLAAVLGSWRALRKKNEDDSMALIAYFIATIAALSFGHFIVSHFGDFQTSSLDLLIGGAALGGIPAYYSSRACATQVFLIQPGGGRALMKILTVYVFGGIWGGIATQFIFMNVGLTYATAFVAGIYLLAAWLYTQGRSEGFAGSLAGA